MKDSHEIRVDHFETTLLWPLFLQWRRDRDGKYTDPKCNPTEKGYVDRWMDAICRESPWSEINHQQVYAYPGTTGESSGPAYAEFCYMHPFVRNFLYLNRGDIRSHIRHQRKQQAPFEDKSQFEREIAAAVNQNLRILQRTDLKGLDFHYVMQPLACDYREIKSSFSIESSWLYLFDTQVALLQIRLLHTQSYVVREGQSDEKHDLNLRMVLRLQDILRRAYAPYFATWRDEGSAWGGHAAGHCPISVTLRKENESQSQSYYGTFQQNATAQQITDWQQGAFGDDLANNQKVSVTQQREHVALHREPFAVNWLKDALSPIVPASLKFDADEGETLFGRSLPMLNEFIANSDTSGDLRFEQIEDDRIPLFSYVAVEGARNIKTGDWLRLAMLDDEGDSNRLPYSPTFFDGDPLREYSYDRFWHPDGTGAAHPIFHRTRWLCCGFGFVGVGDSGDKDFFRDGFSGALAHYHHHYFALMMIAHLHRATLLRLKHALSEAADNLLNHRMETSEASADDQFLNQVNSLNREFLRFRTMYYAPEITNHLQGQEIFQMFRKHLMIEPLFEAVASDLAYADTILTRWSEDAQKRTGDAIAQIGLVLALVGPPFAILSEGWKQFPVRNSIGLFLITFGLLILQTKFRLLINRWIFNPLCRNKRRWCKPFPQGKWIAAGILVAIGMIVLYTGWQIPSDSPSSADSQQQQQQQTTPPAPEKIPSGIPNAESQPLPINDKPIEDAAPAPPLIPPLQTNENQGSGEEQTLEINATGSNSSVDVVAPQNP